MADEQQDELVATLGIEIDKQKLNDTTKGLKTTEVAIDFLRSATVRLGLALTAIASAGIFTAKQSQEVARLETAASVLGITAQQLQVLQLAAKNSQIDIGQVTGVIGSLRTQLLGFQTGNPPTQLLENLGKAATILGVKISPITSSGKIKDAYTLFREIAVAIGNVGDKSKQAAVSQLIFGQNLLPLIGNGLKNINEAQKEIDSHGLGVTDQQIEKMTEFSKQVNLLGVQMDYIGRTAAEKMIPTFEKINSILSSKEALEVYTVAIGALDIGLQALAVSAEAVINYLSRIGHSISDAFNNPTSDLIGKAALELVGFDLSGGKALEGNNPAGKISIDVSKFNSPASQPLPPSQSSTSNQTTNNQASSVTNNNITNVNGGHNPYFSAAPLYNQYGSNR